MISDTSAMMNTQNMSRMLRKLSTAFTVSVILLSSYAVNAGDEWSEEHIMREISYLAKQLLDKSGEDTVTVESPGYTKPFIGICTEISSGGVKITCVTPGTQAKKAGLQTGDMILQLNSLDMKNEDQGITKQNYYTTVEKMKTGESMTFILERDGKPVEIMVDVGSLSHPAYELKVTR